MSTTQPTPSAAGGMPCPRCHVDLLMSERQGIEIDYCPKCRGVWLDRGELDKLIERSEQQAMAAVPPQQAVGAPPQSVWTAPVAPPQQQQQAPGWGQRRHDDDDDDYRKGGHGGRGSRRRSWLGELFD
ncbi:MAG: zf-TFIIB domain-containing protein [Acetobacteraceae bacterium]